jgi:hypothetical protein
MAAEVTAVAVVSPNDRTRSRDPMSVKNPPTTRIATEHPTNSLCRPPDRGPGAAVGGFSSTELV